MTDFLHHAYGLFGSGNDSMKDWLGITLKEFAKNRKILAGAFSKASPDFFHEKFQTMKIEDSRRIAQIHASRPFSPDTPRVFIIELDAATHEAQNSLLKILEEPKPDNYFFIMAPTADTLIPTVRSRLHILDRKNFLGHGTVISSASVLDSVLSAKDFLAMSLAKRITFVDDLAEQISEEKVTKHEAITFLNSLEKYLYDSARASKAVGLPSKKFETIAHARDYANDRAPSVKMLLEYVALSV
jgi:hypothetical protein